MTQDAADTEEAPRFFVKEETGAGLPPVPDIPPVGVEK